MKNSNRIVTTAANPKTKAWEDLLRVCMQDFPDAPWRDPVAVRLHFYVQRPKSAPKRIVLPATRPDIDKLARAVLDAMTSVVFVDDALVVDLQIVKSFGAPGVTGQVMKLGAGLMLGIASNDGSEGD